MEKKLRCADRHQVQMICASLDDLLPRDHRARLIWRAVEMMDTAPLLARVRSVRGADGAPAIDPCILLALWLFATAEGIASSRKLERACLESLPFMWLSGGTAPSYGTLSSFRKEAGADLDRLLTQGLAALASEGIVTLEELSADVAHDGLRIRASAGRSSYKRRETLERLHALAKERWEQIKREAEREEKEAGRQGDLLKGKGGGGGQEGGAERKKRKLTPSQAARERSAREREERLGEALTVIGELEKMPRKKGRGAPRASTTDPRALRMKMPNSGIDPGWNAQFSTARGTGLITSLTLGKSGSDYGLLLPAARDHERRVGQLPRRLHADVGFAQHSDVAALEGAGAEVYMPEAKLPKGKRRQPSADPLVERWRARMASEEALALYKQTRAQTAEHTNALLRQRCLYRTTLRGRAGVLTHLLLHGVAHNILAGERLRAAKREG